MAVRREVGYDCFAFTVTGAYLFRSYSRLDPNRSLAAIGAAIELLHIVPFAVEPDPSQHPLLAQQIEYFWPDALGLHIQDEPDVLFPSQSQCIFKQRHLQVLEPFSHPGAGVAKTQILVVGFFCFAHAVRQSLQEAIVVEYDLSVQRSAQVNLHYVASHQGG